MGIFAKVCRGNGKNYGWHDMKNPGGSNLQFPSGLFSAPFNFETKNRRSFLGVTNFQVEVVPILVEYPVGFLGGQTAGIDTQRTNHTL